MKKKENIEEINFVIFWPNACKGLNIWRFFRVMNEKEGTQDVLQKFMDKNNKEHYIRCHGETMDKKKICQITEL